MFQFLLKSKYHNLKFPSRFSLQNPKPLIKYNLNENIDENEITYHVANNNIKTYAIKEMYFELDLIIFFTDTSHIYVFNTITSHLSIITLFSTSTCSAKSITINKSNNCLLIVYVSKANGIQELKCVEISIEKLKTNPTNNFIIDDFSKLFEREVFISPAFIEFDDVNKIILTKNSLGTFKIWSMENYKTVFEITDKRIEEVRLAEEVLLTIKSTNILEKILLSVYDIRNGKNLYNYEIDLIPNYSLIFLELFKHVLFMKQEYHVPLFINLITLENYFLREDFDDDAFFIYINTKKIILAFSCNIIYFYDLKGRVINKVSKQNTLNSLSPNDIAISNNKKYFCVCWKFLNDDSSQRTVLRKSQYSSGSKRSMISNSRSRYSKLFSCSLSPISQENEELNVGMIEEETYNEMNSGNCLEIYDLDYIEKGVTYRFNLQNNINISSLIFFSNYMKIYYVTIYGKICEISL